MNLGQIVGEVERGACGVKTKVDFLGRANGEFITPTEIYQRFGRL